MVLPYKYGGCKSDAQDGMHLRKCQISWSHEICRNVTDSTVCSYGGTSQEYESIYRKTKKQNFLKNGRQNSGWWGKICFLVDLAYLSLYKVLSKSIGTVAIVTERKYGE